MEESELTFYILTVGNIHKISEIFSCSTSTIKNYIKRYNITIPKGFYSLGKKVGRPKGTPMTEEQKQLRSALFSGVNNPMFGKSHTDLTKIKMSKNHADFTGNNNPFKNSLQDVHKLAEHKKRCKDTWDSRGVVWREVFANKVSKAVAQSFNLQNSNLHKHHKSRYMFTKKAGKIFVRSSWEEKVAQYLDDNILVSSFSLEKLTVPYITAEGTTRYSRIDFMVILLTGINLMIEVKPKAVQAIKNNPYKIKGYKSYCDINNMFFILLDEDYMDNLEKLNLQVYN